jgi:hypothetical protein
LLALLVFAIKAEDVQDDNHDIDGYSLRLIGKAPKFQFAPSADNSSWVRVEFGSVYEQTESGEKVPVHSIESLAAVKPVYTTGEIRQLSGHVRPYGQQQLPCPARTLDTSAWVVHNTKS